MDQGRLLPPMAELCLGTIEREGKMATAIVRLIEDKQIVGMFAYDTKEGLFNLIDQVVSPYACEYINFKYGGVLWESKTKPLVVKEDEDLYFDEAKIDGYLFEDIMNADKWNIFPKPKIDYDKHLGCPNWPNCDEGGCGYE